eukprot:CAMPEP_0119009730 /NCGR_PEP_ID=MMETSP1176-20130426/4564_1 /TAXON_ID=265551 /ORGANISM="Synedropsis recta cf, Strain CCMP1620" /LENGTH=157 /DNA_ID=CAMNT_0006962299 /DNA_START=351 /DNA_END=824 /DNA_ORIENTATION=-
MTTDSSSEATPTGYKIKPDDEATYRQGKDGQWYTYHDCNKANRLYLGKKWESELGEFQATTDSHAPKKEKKRPALIASDEPKAPIRKSSRPSVAPGTTYSTVVEETKEGTKGKTFRKQSRSLDERREQQWNESYKSLQKYGKANGDYNVAQGRNEQL